MNFNFTPTPLKRERYDGHTRIEDSGEVLQIICVTYNQREELKCFINSIKNQTINNWFLRIIHNGNCDKYKTLKKELEAENYLNKQVTIECTSEKYNDWEYSLRDYALKTQYKKSDWTIITNGSSYYAPTLAEAILNNSSKNPKVELLYWNFIQRFDPKTHKVLRTTYQPLTTKLLVGQMDIRAVAVKTTIAEEIGLGSRNFETNWHYILGCLAKIESKIDDQLKKEWQVFKKITQKNEEEYPIDFLGKITEVKQSKVTKIEETLLVHI